MAVIEPATTPAPVGSADMTLEEIARSFSSHRFEATYPYLADGIDWDNIGGQQLSSKAEVVETCNQSSQYLTKVTTRFLRFQVVAGEARVVIDSLAEYVDEQREKTTVASCDLYDFADGLLVGIMSYTIEVNS